ncbi:tripartite tricarboxylate transporter substrate-binding protein [Bradyrhizobium sp. AUGA SZCCT0283]|uniref:tripartite tricarboxylate transporter substrate-binding protein n=1 Tax=Bradyrhizobium sp. AUGA SZCCT0283 TaxID=2807671 RepID=UPI001BA53C21|nr:tripartite tricarboxylate transporter substrate-binding protein [Bradyrhizobium sp. AUGA SZCCT0283]MBR1279268.1 hypothetical protein [Bradyrhizobium sp. AUGA SZCCT0283]
MPDANPAGCRAERKYHTAKSNGFIYPWRGEWYGVYAPAKTPIGVVAQLNQAVVEAVRSTEFGRRLSAFGVQATGTSADGFAKIEKFDSELRGAVVKASRLKPE